MKIFRAVFGWYKNLKLVFKILLPIIIIGLLWFVLSPKKKSEPIEYSTVQKSEIKETVSTSGVLTGKDVAELKFPLAGRLIYLAVKPGDMVKKGQTIAQLDTTVLNAAYQEALNTRRKTQAAVDNAHDQVKDHSGDETYAQKETRTTAEAANDSAYDAVLAAQKALRDAVLYSPIAGIVADQDQITAGQNITITNLIAQIVDFSEKEFWADVDESDIGRIKIGQKAEITLNAYDEQVFTGEVFEIVPQTTTSSDGATVVTVKIKLDNQDIVAVNGLNGQVNIITNMKDDVITIPQSAIVGDNEVYVKRNGKPEKTKVELGLLSDIDVEVVSGLNVGDEIVTNPEVIK